MNCGGDTCISAVDARRGNPSQARVISALWCWVGVTGGGGGPGNERNEMPEP